jgi:hypothetical protein
MPVKSNARKINRKHKSNYVRKQKRYVKRKYGKNPGLLQRSLLAPKMFVNMNWTTYGSASNVDSGVYNSFRLNSIFDPFRS